MASTAQNVMPVMSTLEGVKLSDLVSALLNPASFKARLGNVVPMDLARAMTGSCRPWKVELSFNDGTNTRVEVIVAEIAPITGGHQFFGVIASDKSQYYNSEVRGFLAPDGSGYMQVLI